jgi:hypothetical protein
MARQVAAKPMILDASELRHASHIPPMRAGQYILAKTNEKFICKS